MKKQPSEGAYERARALRREMTEAEKKLWQMLRSRQTEGYRFRRRVPIGRFIADFACHEARLIVEIDGGQHDPSSELESTRTRFLEGEGYRVLRFWNHELLDNPDGARTVLVQHPRRVHPHPGPPPSWGRAGF
jgi:very-short-patch-repair endonuclease